MKKRYVIGSLLALVVGFQASAQSIENDDMYFNAKDREKLKSVEAEGALQTYSSPKKKKEIDQAVEAEENLNPTDSYSARSINPEYISRSNSAQASDEEQNYFVEGYTPNTYDSYSSTKYNNAYPNNFNNNWGYANNYYGNYYNPYDYSRYGYSPYGYYNPYGTYGSPYSYGSGWTLSLGYYSGFGYGSGWNYGLNYGWGSPYYNLYAYSPYYSPYYGGYNYYGGSYERSNVTYGKRPSRNSAVVVPTQQRTRVVSSSSSTSGRMRQTSDEYYVKPARRASNFDWSTISNTNSERGNSNDSRTRSSYSSPSRSSGSSYSSPSRSSYSSPARSGGGGTGGGRSRSKN